MKKIKAIIGMIGMYLLMMPTVLAVEVEKPLSYVKCGTTNGIPAPMPLMTSIAFTLLIIGTPLVFIAFGIVTLVKAVTAQKEDEIMKARNKLLRKLIAALLVFVVAGFSQFVIKRAADDSEKETITTCLSCFLYNSGCVEDPDALRPDVSPPPGYDPNAVPDREENNNLNTYNPSDATCLTSGSYTNGNGNDPDPRCPIKAMGRNADDFIYPSDANGKSLGAWPKDHALVPTTHPNPTYGKNSSVIIPVTPNASTGRYSGSYEHGGRDFSTSLGAPVYAPADGTLGYSTWGHTKNRGYNETAYSIRLVLSTPITVDGKTVNAIFMTHLMGIKYRCSNSNSYDVNCNITVKKGELIGFNGTANSTPHVHFGFCASTGDPNCAVIQTTAINNFFGI